MFPSSRLARRFFASYASARTTATNLEQHSERVLSSSRGYFLGQIIDDLDGIAHQVENRARLGFLDLNRMLEDFFKDVLNVVLDGDFRNLNEQRSNEPGLDLGSDRLRIGVQVTSSASSKKVNDTLSKVTDQQLNAYDRIIILVIGDRQGSYALDPNAVARTNFSISDIWDLTELCRRATSLSLVQLQDLHRLVNAEVARVRVELELPRPDGSYPTGLESYIEQVGRPTFSDGSVFFESEAAQGAYETVDEAAADLRALAERLAQLPRISREFFALLVEKSEDPRGIGSYSRRSNADLIVRISRYPDTEGELRFLMDRGFISYDPPEEMGTSAYFSIHLPGAKPRGGHFYDAFFGFLADPGFDLKRVFVSLDFSTFGAAVLANPNA